MPNQNISVEPNIYEMGSLDTTPAEEVVQDEHLHGDLEYEEELREKGVSSDEDATEFEALNVARWRAAKSLLVLKKQVNLIAPGRSRTSDGTIGDVRHCGRPRSTSDHCARIRDAGIGVVTAMDITHDPSDGCDADAIAESIREHKDQRVKYVIWNRRIFASYVVRGKPAWNWRPYNGSNGHTKHVHISVKSDKASYDSQLAWNLSRMAAADADV